MVSSQQQQQQTFHKFHPLHVKQLHVLSDDGQTRGVAKQLPDLYGGDVLVVEQESRTPFVGVWDDPAGAQVAQALAL